MDLRVLALHQAGIEYPEYRMLKSIIDEKGFYDEKELLETIGSRKAAKIAKAFADIDRIQKDMSQSEVSFVSCEDDIFPTFLTQMPDPAYLLYYRGDVGLLNEFSIGMIGSRKPTAYGRYAATKFASELAKEGVVIVSGLALGIDTLSHKGATENNGKTIAILGTAIDNIYPRTNIKYAKQILDDGNLIVSEFAPQMSTLPFHFVQRNRLISGLSDGLLIVEAGEKSGTLTTVDFALEQGKMIFSIPGNINSLNSTGTNRLIKTGAKMVTELQDIMEEFPYYIPKAKEKLSEIKLSEDEKAIYDVLSEHGVLTNEEISFFTNQNIKYIIGTLGVLELKGIIKDLGNNTYTISLR